VDPANNEKLNRLQIRKGLSLLVGFMALRLGFTRLWLFPLYGEVEFRADIHSMLFLVTAFLLISVGLVYLGFTRWVGVDLKKWWFHRGNIRGDMAWGVGTTIVFAVLIPIVVITLCILLERLGYGELVARLKEPGIERTASVDPFALHLFAIELLMGLFFGFALASFNEETLFRGFLQPILSERIGPWRANFLQAALFSLSHVGLVPMGSLQLTFTLVFIFVSGLVFGWLKMKRGTLLAAGLCHGLMG
jgi:membrane protease YdiL (CAAX protease family)